MKRPTVSIVIPTLNAGMGFRVLLAALGAQRLPDAPEIIVIDSGSKDETLELARGAGARVIRVPHHSFHHARTRNRAILDARGEFVVMTVQDALPVDDTWLARLLAPLLECPDVGGSYGLQLAPATASLTARTLSAAWCASYCEPEVKSLASPAGFWELAPERRLELVRFDNVTSCLRRSVWERLPLPDLGYGEDMAWAKSVLLAGHKVAFVPTAQVWHYHERSWLYELRRAYVDGAARVCLVGWPSPRLEVGEALTMLRRLLFFLRTHRFDALVDAKSARRFLAAELYHYGPEARPDDKPAQAYESALRFCWGLTNTAERLSGGSFPEGGWIDLLRYASVSVVGQQLGANSVGARQHAAFERLVWSVLHSIFSRGV